MSASRDTKHENPSQLEEAVLEDPRWEKLAAGEATPHDIAVLRALAGKYAVAAHAWRMFQPATNDHVDRVAQRVTEQLTTHDLLPVKTIRDARTKSLRQRTAYRERSHVHNSRNKAHSSQQSAGEMTLGADPAITTTSRGALARGMTSSDQLEEVDEKVPSRRRQKRHAMGLAMVGLAASFVGCVLLVAAMCLKSPPAPAMHQQPPVAEPLLTALPIPTGAPAILPVPIDSSTVPAPTSSVPVSASTPPTPPSSRPPTHLEARPSPSPTSTGNSRAIVKSQLQCRGLGVFEKCKRVEVEPLFPYLRPERPAPAQQR